MAITSSKHSFTSPIWRLVPDYFSPRVIVESRDDDLQEVVFDIVDLTSKKIILKGLTFENGWWMQAYALVDNIILFQYFNDENDPSNYSLFGYSINDNEIVWEKENLMIGSFDDQAFFGQKSDDTRAKAFFSFDTGEAIDSKVSLNIPSQKFFYPTSFDQESTKFQVLKSFILSKASETPVIQIEYFENDHHFVLGWYNLEAKGKLSLHIGLFKIDGSTEFIKKLSEGMSGIGDHTFSIWENIMIFVQDKTHLFYHDL